MTDRRLPYDYVSDGSGGRHLSTPTRLVRQWQPYLFSNSPLDDVDGPRTHFEALAATFDLGDFSSFCGRSDGHMQAVPFLQTFFDWLFNQIVERSRKYETGDVTLLWSRLPVWEKFTGDGMLLLWDVSEDQSFDGNEEIGNLVTRLRDICVSYRADFLPTIQRKPWRNPPQQLRCGVARGAVYPIGNEPDFIGNCINLATRLQKVNEHDFVCARAGIDSEKCFSEAYLASFLETDITVRGTSQSIPVLISMHLG